MESPLSFLGFVFFFFSKEINCHYGCGLLALAGIMKANHEKYDK